MVKNEYLELVRYNEVSGALRITPDANHKNLFSKLAQFKDSSVYRPLRLTMFYFLISIIISGVPWKPFISKIMAEVGLLNNQSLLLVNIPQPAYPN